MQTFSKLKFKELWKEEIIAFGSDLSKVIQPFLAANAGIQPAYQQFVDQWSRISPFFQDDSGSVHTNELTDLDAVRDSDITGIKLIARGYVNHRSVDVKKAAQLIINTLNGFGNNIPRLSNIMETETINKLVDIFENDANVKAALALLHLTEWVAPLKATNQEFNTLFLVRNKELAGKPSSHFLEEKPKAEEAYEYLVDVIKSLNRIAPKPELDDLTNEVNELITKYNFGVSQRQGKRASKKVKDENPASGDPNPA